MPAPTGDWETRKYSNKFVACVFLLSLSDRHGDFRQHMALLANSVTRTWFFFFSFVVLRESSSVVRLEEVGTVVAIQGA
jgi:hypothetical protein